MTNLGFSGSAATGARVRVTGGVAGCTGHDTRVNAPDERSEGGVGWTFGCTRGVGRTVGAAAAGAGIDSGAGRRMRGRRCRSLFDLWWLGHGRFVHGLLGHYHDLFLYDHHLLLLRGRDLLHDGGEGLLLLFLCLMRVVFGFFLLSNSSGIPALLLFLCRRFTRIPLAGLRVWCGRRFVRAVLEG